MLVGTDARNDGRHDCLRGDALFQCFCLIDTLGNGCAGKWTLMWFGHGLLRTHEHGRSSVLGMGALWDTCIYTLKIEWLGHFWENCIYRCNGKLLSGPGAFVDAHSLNIDALGNGCPRGWTLSRLGHRCSWELDGCMMT